MNLTRVVKCQELHPRGPDVDFLVWVLYRSYGRFGHRGKPSDGYKEFSELPLQLL